MEISVSPHWLFPWAFTLFLGLHFTSPSVLAKKTGDREEEIKEILSVVQGMWPSKWGWREGADRSLLVGEGSHGCRRKGRTECCKRSLLLRGRQGITCKAPASAPGLSPMRTKLHCHGEFEDSHAQKITKQGGTEQMGQTDGKHQDGRLKSSCFSNYTKYKWIQHCSKIQGLPDRIKKKKKKRPTYILFTSNT